MCATSEGRSWPATGPGRSAAAAPSQPSRRGPKGPDQSGRRPMAGRPAAAGWPSGGCGGSRWPPEENGASESPALELRRSLGHSGKQERRPRGGRPRLSPGGQADISRRGLAAGRRALREATASAAGTGRGSVESAVLTREPFRSLAARASPCPGPPSPPPPRLHRHHGLTSLGTGQVAGRLERRGV